MQSAAAEKGYFPAWWLSLGLRIAHYKQPVIYKMPHTDTTHTHHTPQTTHTHTHTHTYTQTDTHTHTHTHGVSTSIHTLFATPCLLLGVRMFKYD